MNRNFSNVATRSLAAAAILLAASCTTSGTSQSNQKAAELKKDVHGIHFLNLTPDDYSVVTDCGSTKFNSTWFSGMGSTGTPYQPSHQRYKYTVKFLDHPDGNDKGSQGNICVKDESKLVTLYGGWSQKTGTVPGSRVGVASLVDVALDYTISQNGSELKSGTLPANGSGSWNLGNSDDSYSVTWSFNGTELTDMDGLEAGHSTVLSWSIEHIHTKLTDYE